MSKEISLRAIEPEDLDQLYDVENDMSLWGVGVTNVPYSRFLLHEYIADNTGDIYTDKQVRLMVENSAKDVVGIVDLTNFSPSHLRAEIGIVIKREFRRQGYARAATEKMIGYSRNILHLHQLYALAATTNEAALRLFDATGFTRRHILKDWLYDGRQYSDAIFCQLFF